MAKSMILNSLSLTHATLLSLTHATLLSLVSISKSDSLTNGFSIDLIHRDSPQSPFYNPSLTPSQRIRDALQRSSHRFKRNPSRQSPESDTFISGGSYLMKFSVGTPPVSSFAIVDTGSDITWTQCSPCIICFRQKLPLFKPSASSTYRKIPCNSPICKSLQDHTFCKETGNNCLYIYNYADESFTKGELATDTITLASSGGGTVSIPNIVLGCGFSNRGTFFGVESGIVGLGGGKASLVRQLGPLAQGKFSYCLVSDNAKSSKLNFGAKAEVSGRGVVSTPIVRNSEGTTYYLSLQGISVGDQEVEFYDPLLSDFSRDAEEGNIIIDSGTTVTVLPRDFYDELVKAVKSRIMLKQIKHPQGSLDLCYFSKEDAIEIPDITVHFEGADVNWKQDNAFVRAGEDALCFAARAMKEDDLVPVYGNLAQVNFLVGYDLEKRTVSFKATNCGN